MRFSVLKCLVEFMYCGKTQCLEENLDELVSAAQFLKIKGLSKVTKEGLGIANNSKYTHQTKYKKTDISAVYSTPSSDITPPSTLCVIATAIKKVISDILHHIIDSRNGLHQ